MGWMGAASLTGHSWHQGTWYQKSAYFKSFPSMLFWKDFVKIVQIFWKFTGKSQEFNHVLAPIEGKDWGQKFLLGIVLWVREGLFTRGFFWFSILTPSAVQCITQWTMISTFLLWAHVITTASCWYMVSCFMWVQEGISCHKVYIDDYQLKLMRNQIFFYWFKTTIHFMNILVSSHYMVCT